MDTLPVELISHILSFLPLIDRVKCESINRKFNYICKDLWNQQTSIEECELPTIKWIKEFQGIYPNSTDQSRADRIRWQLTLKCPRIKKITIDDEQLHSAFFIQRVPFIQHLTVRNFTESFVILKEAKSLQTIVFENSDCNEYNVIQHLTADIKSIESPSICDPWVNKWDEFFEHSSSGHFHNLVKLTVVISLYNDRHLENLTKLEQLNHIRFIVGNDFDNRFLIKYLQINGSKLKGLELFQPNYHTSFRNVYAAVSSNCFHLEQLGTKGFVHGRTDGDDFKDFLSNFKSLKILSLNIPRTLTAEDVDMVCENNQNLCDFKYTYYMPSISPQMLKNCRRNYYEMKLLIDKFNARNPERRNIIFGTSDIINTLLANRL